MSCTSQPHARSAAQACRLAQPASANLSRLRTSAHAASLRHAGATARPAHAPAARCRASDGGGRSSHVRHAAASIVRSQRAALRRAAMRAWLG